MISIVIPSLPGFSVLCEEAICSFKSCTQSKVEFILEVSDAPFAVNVNAGLRKAKGDIILVSNNDVTALPGWDAWLLEAGATRDSLIAMSPRPDCGWAWGMHKEVGQQIGELDEMLTNSYEDYDYFIRGALLGIGRKMAVKYYMIHEGGHTVDKIWGTYVENSDKRLAQCHRNREYMLRKWPGIDIDAVPHIDWALAGVEIMQAWKVKYGKSYRGR